MKQYRLKITWSNGDIEYLTDPENCTEGKIRQTLTMEKNLNPAHRNWIYGNKMIYTDHVRKIEWEEYIPEKEVKF